MVKTGKSGQEARDPIKTLNLFAVSVHTVFAVLSVLYVHNF